jgi:hypothetical protein
MTYSLKGYFSSDYLWNVLAIEFTCSGLKVYAQGVIWVEYLQHIVHKVYVVHHEGHWITVSNR